MRPACPHARYPSHSAPSHARSSLATAPNRERCSPAPVPGRSTRLCAGDWRSEAPTHATPGPHHPRVSLTWAGGPRTTQEPTPRQTQPACHSRTHAGRPSAPASAAPESFTVAPAIPWSIARVAAPRRERCSIAAAWRAVIYEANGHSPDCLSTDRNSPRFPGPTMSMQIALRPRTAVPASRDLRLTPSPTQPAPFR